MHCYYSGVALWGWLYSSPPTLPPSHATGTVTPPTRRSLAYCVSDLLIFIFPTFRGLRFPVCFSAAQRKKWRPAVPNIPDLPRVVVVPVLRVNQCISELHKFLQHGTFDVLPYLGTWSFRQTWWTLIEERSKQPVNRRIIVTSPKVRFPFLFFKLGRQIF
jgi:hypothetical protein